MGRHQVSLSEKLMVRIKMMSNNIITIMGFLLQNMCGRPFHPMSTLSPKLGSHCQMMLPITLQSSTPSPPRRLHRAAASAPRATEDQCPSAGPGRWCLGRSGHAPCPSRAKPASACADGPFQKVLVCGSHHSPLQQSQPWSLGF